MLQKLVLCIFVYVRTSSPTYLSNKFFIAQHKMWYLRSSVQWLPVFWDVMSTRLHGITAIFSTSVIYDNLKMFYRKKSPSKYCLLHLRKMALMNMWNTTLIQKVWPFQASSLLYVYCSLYCSEKSVFCPQCIYVF